MRVEKEDTDYYVFLTEKEILEVGRKKKFPLGEFYPWLYSEIIDRLEKKVTKETLALTCTRNASTLREARDGICFELEKDGPTVRVYPPVLGSLFEKDFVVTRYNAESKIWIYLDRGS